MKVDIISKDNCSYCTSAKILLERRGLPYNERKLGEGLSRDEIIKEFPNARTFPIISVDDEYIGGYDQLAAMLRDYE